MFLRSRGETLSVALLVAVVVVPLARAEVGARMEPEAARAASPLATQLPEAGGADDGGARCCSVQSGACRGTAEVCASEEISVWCDADERASMAVHGEWTCG